MVRLMKYLLIAKLLLITICIGCTKDEPIIIEPPTNQELIVGTWNVDSVIFLDLNGNKDVCEDFTYVSEDSAFGFGFSKATDTKNGTFWISYMYCGAYNLPQYGVYTIDTFKGGRLLLNGKQFYIIKLNKEKMELESIGDNYNFYFTKK